MNKKTCGMSLVIIVALLVPILSSGIQNIADTPSIWIVFTESPDESMTIAAQTFRNEMTSSGCIVQETTLDQVESIPMNSDAIAIVGHGSEEGITFSDGIMPWDTLYNTIQNRKPQNILSLACYSPTITESRIFGFMGEIDAETGAIIGTWHLSQILDLDEIDNTLFTRAIEAQKTLDHPLSRVLYFIHGYFGNASDFDDMIDYLEGQHLFYGSNPYDSYHSFSIYDIYNVHTPSEKNLLHQTTSISDYATLFANWLMVNHDPGTQVSIIAHSLGGIITRLMLQQSRDTIEGYGIDFGSITTFGTPHHGTYLAEPTNFMAWVSYLVTYYATAQLWPSPILWSLYPESDFLNSLNYDPLSYSDGIRWYTVAGYEPCMSALMFPLHEEFSDPVVGESKAKLSFALESPTYQNEHSYLLKDPDLSFPSIEAWLRFDIDSDNDGLYDDMETYRYGTDKYSWDTDGDLISDWEELNEFNTDPLNPDSDFDGLSDFDDFMYGLDPLNPDYDSDNLLDEDEFVYGTDPFDADYDNDGILDGNEVHIYNTNPTAWSTDGDILSDNQEISWGYDPNNTDDPIDAQYLTYSAWQISGITGRVRANHYTAMDYVKVYVRYKNSMGYWTGDMLAGTDDTPGGLYPDDYFVEWSLLSGYVQMLVTVKAYDSSNHYLGCDQAYVTLPGGGGGGGGGGDPLPD